MSDGWKGDKSNRCLEDNGAPEGNGNGVKHNLFSDRDKMYKRLDTDDQRLVTQIASDLLERLEGDIGAYERESVRNIAIDTIKRSHFNDYEGSMDPEKQNVHEAYSRIRRDNIKEMKEMGLNVQAPEAKEAQAKQNWFGAIEDAEDE